MMLRLPIISPTMNQKNISTPTRVCDAASFIVKFRNFPFTRLFFTFTKLFWMSGNWDGIGGANSTLAVLQNVERWGRDFFPISRNHKNNWRQPLLIFMILNYECINKILYINENQRKKPKWSMVCKLLKVHHIYS